MRKRRATPEGKRYKKGHDLKHMYGITFGKFQDMALDQLGMCAICDTDLDMGFHTHVDHDHKTGKVRGLLCSRCNLALGYLRDSIKTLKRAIAYLKGETL